MQLKTSLLPANRSSLDPWATSHRCYFKYADASDPYCMPPEVTEIAARMSLCAVSPQGNWPD